MPIDEIKAALTDQSSDKCIFSRSISAWNDPCSGKDYWADVAALGLTLAFPKRSIRFHAATGYSVPNGSALNDESSELGLVNANRSLVTPLYLYLQSQRLVWYPDLTYFGPIESLDKVALYRADILPATRQLSLRMLGQASAVGIFAIFTWLLEKIASRRTTIFLVQGYIWNLPEVSLLQSVKDTMSAYVSSSWPSRQLWCNESW